MIVPIIEGQSEEASVPILIRRLLRDQGVHSIQVRRGFRVRRDRLVQQGVLERSVQVARLEEGARAITILVDADDDCPGRLGPDLLARGQPVAGDGHLSVTLAKMEIEAWLIAGVESIRGVCGIREDITPPTDPEGIQGAKEWLTRQMHGRRRYVAVDDLPTLLDCFDYQLAATRSRSLRKFIKNIEAMVVSVSAPPTTG